MIAENDRGDRVFWNGKGWVPLPNKTAPGAAFLPAMPADDGNRSEDAYYRQWRDKDNTNVSAARAGVVDARRAEGLIVRQQAQGQGTGGIYGVPVIGGIAAWMDPELRELDAIQAKVARSNRTPGEGAISDFDAQQFLAMTYGKDKPMETNKALIQAQRIANDAAIQRRQFAEWHYNTFGTTSGMEEAWDRYAQANPIFDPETEAQGQAALNAKRQGWREYFGAVRSEGDRAPTRAQEDVQRTATPPSGAPRKAPGFSRSMPKAQVDAAMRFKGSTARGGTPENPYTPGNEAEYDTLPSGAYYLDPSGKMKVKR